MILYIGYSMKVGYSLNIHMLTEYHSEDGYSEVAAFSIQSS